MHVGDHRIVSVDVGMGLATRVMGEEPRRGDEPVTRVRAI
jgi:hypothetical protein